MKKIIQKYTSLGTDFRRNIPFTIYLISFKNDMYRLYMQTVLLQGRNIIKKLVPEHFKHEEHDPEIH